MKQIIISLLLLVSFKIIAQDTLITDGFYQMELPKNYNKQLIEKECINFARLNGLEKAFGSVLSQNNTTDIQNQNINNQVKTSQSFSSTSFSYLTGKWVKDINEPLIEYFNYKKQDWISVTVKGKVRQVDINTISQNPTSANDFLALAFNSNSLGNDRKSIDYLDNYFQKTEDNFFEPHQLYIDLMESEDRQNESIEFYQTRYGKDSSIFNLLMLTIAQKNEMEIIDISKKYPSDVLAKILMIKILSKNNLLLPNYSITKSFCLSYERGEELNEFINSKYYKGLNCFLSSNAAKNIFTEMEKMTLFNISNLRKNEMKDKIKAGIEKRMTKEQILQLCLNDMCNEIYGCTIESVTKLFNSNFNDREYKISLDIINDHSAVLIEWVQIPAGTFIMGSPSNEVNHESDEAQHQVTLSAFKMSKNEVTFAQYDVFCEKTGRTKPYDEGLGRGDRPVINVSWEDASAFANWMGCRLPTESEWEYACRAGGTTPFNTGNNLITNQANYNGDNPYDNNPKGVFLEKTMPVGTYPSNTWGLNDMHGNVWEWCSDWYGNYPSSAQTNPTGATSGSHRVSRGGGWYNNRLDCRSANRNERGLIRGDRNLGFRLVVAP